MNNDYISKKALLEWLQNEADERKGIPLLHGNIQSYLRTKEFVESGRFDIPSPSEGEAEGRYRDALEQTLYALKRVVSGQRVLSLDEIIALAESTLALSPIGEQKEDTEEELCARCGRNRKHKHYEWCLSCRPELEESPDAK